MSAETITPAEIDAGLDWGTIKQLIWKNDTCKRVAVLIVESFLKDKIQWSDDVNVQGLDDKDKNIIGLTWRRLAKLGILKRMEGAEDHRRSKVKSRKGGIVWKYRLVNPALANAFLKRNGWNPTRRNQPELLLAWEKTP